MALFGNNSKKEDGSKLHPMVILQPGERVICEIKRHPFGILSMYIAGLAAVGAVLALAFSIPSLVEQYAYDENFMTYAILGGVLFLVMIGLILVVATVVYWQNRWVVTDDSITQISQISLFNRQVSQLSMENLEDVTVDQNGILQTLFGFGTLKAETAGERSKFVFHYCPNPNKYARLILEVHETFIHQTRHQPQPVRPVMPISNARSQSRSSAAPIAGKFVTSRSTDERPEEPAFGASTRRSPQSPRPNEHGTTLPPNLQ